MNFTYLLWSEFFILFYFLVNFLGQLKVLLAEKLCLSGDRSAVTVPLFLSIKVNRFLHCNVAFLPLFLLWVYADMEADQSK